ncbi:hypothetical protein PS639_04511 [Pseudomonas fluorescens]|nr:hypothetical protein PS639_04511 [Pseudomonas fluorescens]
MRRRKTPYPIPEVLLQDDKFRGEIIITAVYAPPLDPDAGSECVRANIELSFGLIEGDGIKGMVPMDSDEGQNGYESAKISSGSKWSPVRYTARVSPEVTGKQWGLQATAMLQAFKPPLTDPLPVCIVVTVRSLDGDTSADSSLSRLTASTKKLSAISLALLLTRG